MGSLLWSNQVWLSSFSLWELQANKHVNAGISASSPSDSEEAVLLEMINKSFHTLKLPMLASG